VFRFIIEIQDYGRHPCLTTDEFLLIPRKAWRSENIRFLQSHGVTIHWDYFSAIATTGDAVLINEMLNELTRLTFVRYDFHDKVVHDSLRALCLTQQQDTALWLARRLHESLEVMPEAVRAFRPKEFEIFHVELLDLLKSLDWKLMTELSFNYMDSELMARGLKYVTSPEKFEWILNTWPIDTPVKIHFSDAVVNPYLLECLDRRGFLSYEWVLDDEELELFRLSKNRFVDYYKHEVDFNPEFALQWCEEHGKTLRFVDLNGNEVIGGSEE
jgi:hypothetical protein